MGPRAPKARHQQVGSQSPCESDPRWEERIAAVDQFVTDQTPLTPTQKKALAAVMKKHAACICLGTYDDLPAASVPPMQIDTGAAKPICQKMRPIPVAAREFTLDEVIALKCAGFIVKISDSAWASPVHIVPKRGAKKWHMCIDYRQVNAVTTPMAGSVPLIEELVRNVRGKTWLSTFDLASAYHQCPIAEEDQCKTAFVTPWGTFKYTRVPFGLRNAVQYFCEAIAQVLQPVT